MAAAILFCSAPVRSLADGLPPGDEVYVENPNRSYTDVTSQVFFVGSQAYLYPNNPMPITIDYVVRHVFDQYGNLIGYITVPSGG